MRFADLAGRDVAVWGLGREGRSMLAAWRRRFPDVPVTLYCSAAEAAALVPGTAMPARLRVRTDPPDADALAAHAVVVKSPGISAYRPEIAAAARRGTRFTSGTALWFGENPGARVIAVTGTKGKSTTTAMVAHIARALGLRTALAGNIGLPLLDLDGQAADLWAIELSSFQTGDAGAVAVGVVTNLSEEHLDWHGSRERYFVDKLKLAGVARTLVVGADQPELLARTAAHPDRRLFGDARGWYAGAAGLARGEAFLDPGATAVAHLPGAHNAANACAALAALDALLDLDDARARAAVQSLREYRPLPHRLTPLGMRGGLEWIDDSISTTPRATLVALASLPDRAVTVILGGHDRGLDWAPFATAVKDRAGLACIACGAAGARIAGTLRRSGVACRGGDGTLQDAVAAARSCTPAGGVVLLSPGAPSFDAFRNYAERGRAFARLAGFDDRAIGEITGLGIA